MVYSKSTLGKVQVYVPVRGFRLKVKRSEGGEKEKRERMHGWVKGGR